MPVLAGLLTSLFGSAVGILTTFMAARLAIRLAAIAVFTTATLAFVGGSSALLSTLVAQFPDAGMLGTAYWLIFPPEVVSVVGIVFAFDLSVTLYRMTLHNLSILTGNA